MSKQLSLPGLEAHLDLTSVKTRKRLGCRGENLAYQALTEAGYQVVHTRIGEIGDLRVKDAATGELFNVEVKTARQGLDGKWRFTLFTNTSTGRTDHRRTDIVLLLAVDHLGRATPFVIPTEVVKKQHRAVISSTPTTYKGKLARFRQDLAALHL